MSKVRINLSTYEDLHEAAKKINERTSDPEITDMRKKFLRRGDIPTVEDLQAHHVEEDFLRFLPYLVFYREPDVCRIDPDAPDAAEKRNILKRTRKYITQLFDEKMEIVIDIDEEE